MYEIIEKENEKRVVIEKKNGNSVKNFRTAVAECMRIDGYSSEGLADHIDEKHEYIVSFLQGQGESDPTGKLALFLCAFFNLDEKDYSDYYFSGLVWHQIGYKKITWSTVIGVMVVFIEQVEKKIDLFFFTRKIPQNSWLLTCSELNINEVISSDDVESVKAEAIAIIKSAFARKIEFYNFHIDHIEAI